MKRIALISDIHGNYKALEAFLQYIAGHPVEGIICLGDYVTDSPYPERTMALLYGMRRRYECWMLRGNREDYLLNNKDNREGWKPSSANGTLFYTLQRMTETDLDFFASLPTEGELCLEGCPALYLCHGTPGRVRGNVHEEPGLKEKVMEALAYPYLLGGHSHHQEIDRMYGKTYINPGSLGFAVDGVGRRAQFAILTGMSEKWEAELLSIPWKPGQRRWGSPPCRRCRNRSGRSWRSGSGCEQERSDAERLTDKRSGKRLKTEAENQS